MSYFEIISIPNYELNASFWCCQIFWTYFSFHSLERVKTIPSSSNIPKGKGSWIHTIQYIYFEKEWWNEAIQASEDYRQHAVNMIGFCYSNKISLQKKKKVVYFKHKDHEILISCGAVQDISSNSVQIFFKKRAPNFCSDKEKKRKIKFSWKYSKIIRAYSSINNYYKDPANFRAMNMRWHYLLNQKSIKEINE